MVAEAAAEVSALKEQGNALYAAKDFLKAAAVYTKAIKLDDKNEVLYRCGPIMPSALGGGGAVKAVDRKVKVGYISSLCPPSACIRAGVPAPGGDRGSP